MLDALQGGQGADGGQGFGAAAGAFSLAWARGTPHFITALQADHAEGGTALLATLHEVEVANLEDLQGKQAAGEEDGVQGEEG